MAQGQPTAVVVAARERATAETLQRALAGPSFRVYSSDDVVGVELAGAVKNVVAIAAGIVDGLGYGHNTVAALITCSILAPWRMMPACSTLLPTMKPGTSWRKTSGMLNASQI